MTQFSYSWWYSRLLKKYDKEKAKQLMNTITVFHPIALCTLLGAMIALLFFFVIIGIIM